MTTAIVIPDPANLPDKFSFPDTAIAAMAAEYLPLTIAGLADTEGFKRVHDARMMVKGKRVEVEKTRKELKADALKYGQAVDAEARRITALLTPIEDHLEGEERRINEEKDRIKNAARIAAEEAARKKAEEEAAALRAAQEKLAAEQAALAAERAALAAAQAKAEAEQRTAQEKIDAERRAVEAEARRLADLETARKHAEEIAKAQAEAAERARIETEARISREAEAKAASEKKAAEEAEAARQWAEALRPDREKLASVADAVRAITIPPVSPAATKAAGKIRDILSCAAADISYTVTTQLGGNGNGNK